MTSRFVDIADLCHRVHLFQHKMHWRFKAMPVIDWEFASVGDFMDARALLEQAVMINRQNYTQDSVRLMSPHTVEIDCCGVTFRLTCIALHDTPLGPMGVAQMKQGLDIQTQPPTFRDVLGPIPRKADHRPAGAPVHW